MLDMLMLALTLLYASTELSGVALAKTDVGGKSR